MATNASATTTAIDAGKPAPVFSNGGRLKFFQETFTFAAQAAGEVFLLFDLPAGFLPFYWWYYLSVSAGGTATLAVGTAASTGRWRAAAIATTIDAPVFFGVSANMMANSGGFAGVGALTAKERVQVLTAAAALPASGFMRIGVAGSLSD